MSISILYTNSTSRMETQIYFDIDALNDILVSTEQKIAFLTDENTYLHCLPILKNTLESLNNKNIINITVPASEETKTFYWVEKIIEELINSQFTKNDVLLIVGGGMLCDLGSFAASIYKRGIQHILIPTSLLAMCDASVGGKTGINFNSIKNAVGTFYPSKYIIIEARFLATLPSIEMKSGFGEVIKHGILQSKEHFDTSVNSYFDATKGIYPNTDLIKSAIDYKLKIVNEDPEEKGLRKILNYGHTIGHALESLLIERGSTLPHGICVLFGIHAENELALQKGVITQETCGYINKKIENILKEFKLTEIFGTDLVAMLQQDKKNKTTGINFSFIRNFGEYQIDSIVDLEMLKEFLQQYEFNHYSM